MVDQIPSWNIIENLDSYDYFHFAFLQKFARYFNDQAKITVQNLPQAPINTDRTNNPLGKKGKVKTKKQFISKILSEEKLGEPLSEEKEPEAIVDIDLATIRS